MCVYVCIIILRVCVYVHELYLIQYYVVYTIRTSIYGTDTAVYDITSVYVHVCVCTLIHNVVAKGLTTYDYIVLQRNKEKEREEREERERRAAQEAGEEQGGGGGGGGEMEERDHHGRCWCLRRKVRHQTDASYNIMNIESSRKFNNNTFFYLFFTQVNRINPGGLERGQRSKDTELAGLETSSISSAGLLQFGRTPTQVCFSLIVSYYIHQPLSNNTHSLTHPLTHSLTHPLTHSPTHPLTHSLTHSLSLKPSLHSVNHGQSDFYFFRLKLCQSVQH